jgi:two-component system NarL family sensor kinase
VASCGLALNISELRVADAKLKVLAQRVVESQEEERARLSRDLHDGISQWLVSIKLQIEAGIARLAGKPSSSKAQAVFEHAADQLSNVMAEVRRISHNLRPAILDDLGLAPRCSTWPRSTQQQRATSFTARPGGGRRLARRGQYRAVPLAQEALTNIERHAGASAIDITLARRADGDAAHPRQRPRLRRRRHRPAPARHRPAQYDGAHGRHRRPL